MEEEGRRGTGSGAAWDEMDTDCLVHIFRLLGLEDVAAAAPLVCRSWRRATRDPTLWRALDLRHDHLARFMPWGTLAAAFAHRYGVGRFAFAGFLRLCVARSRGSAAELALPPLLGSPAAELDYISIECPKLRWLVLPKLASDDEARLPGIMGRWPCLEHLEIETKPSSFVSVAAQIGQICPNFVSLKMAGSIKEEDAMAMVKSLPKLKFLCLDKSYLPKQELVVIMEGCMQLEDLSAKNCVGFDDDDAEVITKGAKIRRLEIGGSRLVDEFDDQQGMMGDGLCDSSYVDVI